MIDKQLIAASIDPKQCIVCKEVPSNPQVCAACEKASYCGHDCAEEDWSRHKITCKETFGYFLNAMEKPFAHLSN